MCVSFVFLSLHDPTLIIVLFFIFPMYNLLMMNVI